MSEYTCMLILMTLLSFANCNLWNDNVPVKNQFLTLKGGGV